MKIWGLTHVLAYLISIVLYLHAGYLYCKRFAPPDIHTDPVLISLRKELYEGAAYNFIRWLNFTLPLNPRFLFTLILSASSDYFNFLIFLSIEDYATINWDSYRQTCAEIDEYSPLAPVMKIAQDFLSIYEYYLPFLPAWCVDDWYI